MIKQNEKLWVVDDTPRRWGTHTYNNDGATLARRYPLPGIDIGDDYPPTVDLTGEEWASIKSGVEQPNVNDPADVERYQQEISDRIDAFVDDYVEPAVSAVEPGGKVLK